MKISIIIPTFNREETLCKTLESVINEINNYPQVGIELILVDQTKNHNAITIDYINSLKQLDFFIYLHLSEANLPHARNEGIKKATGDIILFLDDDVILGNNFIKSMIETFQKDSNIFSVVGKVKILNDDKDNILLSKKSKIKEFVKKCLMFVFNKKKAFIITDLGWILSDSNFELAGFSDGGQGCNMAFKKECFDIWGLFDEKYIGNALREETDMFLRIKKANKGIYYQPQMSLLHVMENNGGCRSENRERYWYTYFYNLCYFYIKNYNYSKITIKLLLISNLIVCSRSGLNVQTIFEYSYNKAKLQVQDCL